jgi:hypothetical protein
LCLEHFRECQAVGLWPDDPVVRRSAAIIKSAEESAARFREIQWQSALIQALDFK